MFASTKKLLLQMLESKLLQMPKLRILEAEIQREEEEEKKLTSSSAKLGWEEIYITDLEYFNKNCNCIANDFLLRWKVLAQYIKVIKRLILFRVLDNVHLKANSLFRFN